MASLNDLIQTKSDRLDSVPDDFSSKVGRSQRAIFDELLILLGEFDVKDGIIQASSENLARVQVVGEQLKQIVFGSGYTEAVIEFAKEFDTQSQLVQEIFQKTFGTFSDDDLFDQVLKASRKRALDALTEDAVVQKFINPLKALLDSQVSGEASFTDMVKLMHDEVLGRVDLDGRLLQYVKTIAFDAFATSDREYTKIIADDMGVIWFRYLGGLVKDSRVFCVNRNGKYYHKREIEDWGQGESIDGVGVKGSERAGNPWQGKNKSTNAGNIFTLLGGWRCLHSVIPVGQTIVPKNVISRNKKKGYI